MAKRKRSIKAKVKRKPRSKPKKNSTRKRVGAKRKPAKKRAVTRKRKPVKRRTRKRKAPKGRQLIKQVERSSVERVMAGKRRRRRKRTSANRRVVLAGSRRRKVGGLGGNGLLIGLGVGAMALYLLTKSTGARTTPGTYTLPPIAQTNNYTRNTQSNELINYAIAGGLAIDAIIKLIDRLNSSSDQEVHNIYDRVSTTGDFSVYV